MEPTTVRIGFLLTILLTLFAEPISSTAFSTFCDIWNFRETNKNAKWYWVCKNLKYQSS